MLLGQKITHARAGMDDTCEGRAVDCALRHADFARGNRPATQQALSALTHHEFPCTIPQFRSVCIKFAENLIELTIMAQHGIWKYRKF
jgi:hypothetical protein